jgi:peptide chain release factor 3
MTAVSPAVASPAHVLGEAARRRTFAVISHPDAGKSTLTEAIALHAKAISSAGAVHGKPGRRGVVSDWMEMERARGISITSAVLQFFYRDAVINLVDTPGHADFSEDTYRVLSAVDSVVMLLDAAKGLEPQTLKLFDVCRHRNLPVITFINKWDRPGRDAWDLCDELADRIGLQPMPVTWPVGTAGDFRGVLDCRDGCFVRYRRMAGAAAAVEELLGRELAEREEGPAWSRAREELDLLAASGGRFDRARFLAAEATPVLFGAAVLNFGVRPLLDALVEVAPGPLPRKDINGDDRLLDAPFSAFVFKVQSGMNPAHRDQLAYARVCSGVFERGMVVWNARTGKPFATKYVHQLFGQQRTTVDTAFPGDVIGLVNASSLRVGDTIYGGSPMVRFPGLISFAPAHFAVARLVDRSRAKQFQRAVKQLQAESVVQVVHSERRGPVLAAVGLLQFDIAVDRLAADSGSEVRLEHLPRTVVRRLPDPSQRSLLENSSECEVLSRADGSVLAVFANQSALGLLRRRYPELVLETVVAGVD